MTCLASERIIYRAHHSLSQILRLRIRFKAQLRLSSGRYQETRLWVNRALYLPWAASCQVQSPWSRPVSAPAGSPCWESQPAFSRRGTASWWAVCPIPRVGAAWRGVRCPCSPRIPFSIGRTRSGSCRSYQLLSLFMVIHIRVRATPVCYIAVFLHHVIRINGMPSPKFISNAPSSHTGTRFPVTFHWSLFRTSRRRLQTFSSYLFVAICIFRRFQNRLALSFEIDRIVRELQSRISN